MKFQRLIFLFITLVLFFIISSKEVYAVGTTMDLTLSTNTITFADYTGASQKYSAFTVTVNSDLPYNLNAKFLSDIQTADLNNKIPFSTVFLQSEEGVKSITDKNIYIPLITNHAGGTNIVSWVNIFLNPDNNIKSGNYSSTLQIEASQN